MMVALVAFGAGAALLGTLVAWGAACVALVLTCTFCAVGAFWLACTAVFASCVLGLMSTLSVSVYVSMKLARLAASLTMALANVSASAASRSA